MTSSCIASRLPNASFATLSACEGWRDQHIGGSQSQTYMVCAGPYCLKTSRDGQITASHTAGQTDPLAYWKLRNDDLLESMTNGTTTFPNNPMQVLDAALIHPDNTCMNMGRQVIGSQDAKTCLYYDQQANSVVSASCFDPAAAAPTATKSLFCVWPTDTAVGFSASLN